MNAGFVVPQRWPYVDAIAVSLDRAFEELDGVNTRQSAASRLAW